MQNTVALDIKIILQEAVDGLLNLETSESFQKTGLILIFSRSVTVNDLTFSCSYLPEKNYTLYLLYAGSCSLEV